MKKFFSKFLKDTRGVVMMEYIILGCFAVAITVVAVLALGKVYNSGLATMGWATLGCTQAAVQQQRTAEPEFDADVTRAYTYGFDMGQNVAAPATAPINYPVYK